MKGPERDLYRSILYRIYATVLAEKLHETNQKAKHFEELTVQLTATQAELEELNGRVHRATEAGSINATVADALIAEIVEQSNQIGGA